MNKKKIFTMMMVLVMMLSLVACKNNNAEAPSEETAVVENTEIVEETTPVVDTIGWKVNPAEVENALPEDIQAVFEEVDSYEGMMFKPIALLAKLDSENTASVLCHAAEDFEAEDVIYKLYDVTVKDGNVIRASEFGLTELMEMSETDAADMMSSFTTFGWKHYMEQPASEFPTAVRNALNTAPVDVEAIHFVAVHGAEDGTLTFAIMGHKAEELVMMFIAVPSGGIGSVVNVVPIANISVR